MKKKKEIINIEQKYQKSKKLNIVLIIIISIGIIGVGLLPIAYLYKDKLGKTTLVQRMNYLRSTINSTYNSNYEYTENIHNAAYKLNLNTGKEDIQATHPKIINFQEKWHGYKYYMVFAFNSTCIYCFYSAFKDNY